MQELYQHAAASLLIRRADRAEGWTKANFIRIRSARCHVGGSANQKRFISLLSFPFSFPFSFSYKFTKPSTTACYHEWPAIFMGSIKEIYSLSCALNSLTTKQWRVTVSLHSVFVLCAM